MKNSIPFSLIFSSKMHLVSKMTFRDDWNRIFSFAKKWSWLKMLYSFVFFAKNSKAFKKDEMHVLKEEYHFLINGNEIVS